MPIYPKQENEEVVKKEKIQAYLSENKEPLHIILGWVIASLKTAKQTDEVFTENPKYLLYLQKLQQTQRLGETDIHIRSQLDSISKEGSTILTPKADERIRRTF